MKGTVTWQGKRCFAARSGTGHELLVDGAPEHGGENRGPRPMELVLLGLGGCSSFDVIQILEKSRQQVSDCELELEAERADGVPAVFTRIHLHFKVSGTDLNPKLVERAVKLSADKYCSASIMLARGGVEIEHSWEIVPA